MFDFLKGIDLRKVSLQTVLGGIAVYVGAKQSGVPDNQAIIAGALSALTSGIASVHNPKKKAKPTPPAAPAAPAGE